MSDKLYDELVPKRDAIVDRHTRLLKQWSDLRLSFWAYEQYKECPQKYIMYCVGDRIPVLKDNYWAVSGSVVHSLWENFVGGLKQGELDWDDRDFLVDNVPTYYDEFVQGNRIDWHANKVEPEEHRASVLPQIRTSIDFVYEELKSQGLVPRDPATIHSEITFRTPIGEGNVKLTGRCDLVFENPESIEIVDLKDVGDRSRVKWKQLIWYVLGLEPYFNKPCIRSGFLLTKLHDWSWRNPNGKVRGGGTYREELKTEVLKTALAISREPFKPNISRFHCPRCPVQKHCPEWHNYSRRNAILSSDIANLSEGMASF